jgi:HSP90 family molecular chaperone
MGGNAVAPMPDGPAAAPNPSSSSICATLWSLGLAKAPARTDGVADFSTLLLDQAQILDAELPNDPAAFATRLNRLVVRGL